jgi:ribosomal protein S18 acetylase RimI-like enzyme
MMIKLIMKPISIRKAQVDDSYALAQIKVNTWRNAYRGLISNIILDKMDIDQNVRIWKKTLSEESQNNVVCVAESPQGILGYAVFGKSNESNFSNFGEVAAIYVSPENQSQGVGKSLMKFGDEIFHSQDYKGAVLWVLAKNLPSIAFYKSLGWEATEIFKESEREGEIFTEHLFTKQF